MLEKMKKKFVLLWGPLFVGAPVRPNILNMPKSASAQSLKTHLGTKSNNQK